ncbi:MAG TPA: HAD-IA family hydrolase, partial [Oligoflexia bacterium]|nr:HAD-IA family hydrolase [Oligoflexia bacterium]
NDELQREVLGMSMFDVHAMLVERHGLKLSRQEFAQYYNDLAGDIYGRQVQLIPGIRRLIERLSASGLVLGVASSSPLSWIDTGLIRFDLAHFFRNVVSAQELPGRGKPHPDVYQLACCRLNILPSQCAAIEDSTKGVASAKSAGLFCVGLRNGMNGEEDLSAADLICEDAELLSPEMLQEMRGVMNQ